MEQDQASDNSHHWGSIESLGIKSGQNSSISTKADAITLPASVDNSINLIENVSYPAVNKKYRSRS